MRKSVKIQKRQSELRERIRNLTAVETRSDEQNAELTRAQTDLGASEADLRAALDAEAAQEAADAAAADAARLPAVHGIGSAEVREYCELSQRACLTRAVDDIVQGRPYDETADREFGQAAGVDLRAEIPWAMMLSPEDLRAVASGRLGGEQERAEGDSVAPASVAAMASPIIRAVFARAALAFLGVRMESVGVGQHVYHVFDQEGAADRPAFVAPGADGAYPAQTLVPTTLKPKRLQSGFMVRYEDLALVSGYDAALRENLTMSLSNALDYAGINGGADPDVPGFIHALGAGTGGGALITFQSGVMDASSGVDGLFAQTRKDLRLLVGTKTYEVMCGLVAANSAVDLSEKLISVLGGFRTSSNMPAVANKKQAAILAKMAGGSGPNAVCPMWGQGVRLIRDEVTEAEAGKLKITLLGLYNLAVLRPAAYVRRNFQVTA